MGSQRVLRCMLMAIIAAWQAGIMGKSAPNDQSLSSARKALRPG